MAAKKKTRSQIKRRKPRSSKVAHARGTKKVRGGANRKQTLKKSGGKRKKVRGKPELVDTVAFEPRGLGSGIAGQAGDLQGVSGAERAASESVEELLEEGNAFEASVVKGVEDAENADEAEVETHEVPEDDVPDEYREGR